MATKVDANIISFSVWSKLTQLFERYMNICLFQKGKFFDYQFLILETQVLEWNLLSCCKKPCSQHPKPEKALMEGRMRKRIQDLEEVVMNKRRKVESVLLEVKEMKKVATQVKVENCRLHAENEKLISEAANLHNEIQKLKAQCLMLLILKGTPICIVGRE
jgi:hypothetical protein